MDEKLLLKPEEAAHRLGLSRARLYELLTPQSGEPAQIESITIGRSRRISVRALEKFVEARGRESQATPVPA